jgi:hypothetical protein
VERAVPVRLCDVERDATSNAMKDVYSPAGLPHRSSIQRAGTARSTSE